MRPIASEYQVKAAAVPNRPRKTIPAGARHVVAEVEQRAVRQGAGGQQQPADEATAKVMASGEKRAVILRLISV